jgi:hypothetical protein
MPCIRQLLSDTFGRQHVLAAGKAMREQRECDRLAQRQIKYRRQFFTLGIRKIKSFATHGWSFQFDWHG